MCNPGYVIAFLSWNEEEKQREKARASAHQQAGMEMSFAGFKAQEKAIELSSRQSNDMRKAFSAQSKATAAIAGRGTERGTAAMYTMQEGLMRTAEIASDTATKEKQIARELAVETMAIGFKERELLAYHESTGMQGLMLKMMVAAASTYVQTGSFGFEGLAGEAAIEAGTVTAADAAVPTAAAAPTGAMAPVPVPAPLPDAMFTAPVTAPIPPFAGAQGLSLMSPSPTLPAFVSPGAAAVPPPAFVLPDTDPFGLLPGYAPPIY